MLNRSLIIYNLCRVKGYGEAKGNGEATGGRESEGREWGALSSMRRRVFRLPAGGGGMSSARLRASCSKRSERPVATATSVLSSSGPPRDHFGTTR